MIARRIKESEPRRFAIKYEPPTIIVEAAGEYGKFFHHSFEIKNISVDMDPDDLYQAVTKQADFLKHPRINASQVQRLLGKLIEYERKVAEGDFQQVSEERLAAAKMKMEETYSANTIDKTHPDYVYDKKAEFEGDEESSWD